MRCFSRSGTPYDVDGTSWTNYQHALAWFRAFRRYDITRPMWRIHRGIGMGDGAHELLAEVKERGFRLVLAPLTRFTQRSLSRVQRN